MPNISCLVINLTIFMSKLTVTVTFAPIIYLRNFAEPSVFFGYLKLSGILSAASICKGHQVNHLEQHYSTSW